MALLTTELADTIAARWRRRLKGMSEEEDDGLDKSHWRTKAAYYRAVEDHLVDAQSPPLTWQAIVDRVEPKGSRTTFYLVIGAKAAHPLLRNYEAGPQEISKQIAALYDRGSAVQKLLDEMKVWSYWAYRTGWLAQLALVPDFSRRQAAGCLVRTLADWAVRHPETARALDDCPPMAAVEDLLVIWDRKADAVASWVLLRDVIVCAQGPLGTTTDGVLQAVRARLEPLAAAGPPAADAVLADLTAAAFGGIREISAMPEASRAQTRDAAVTMLEDAAAELRQLW
jgi:hypothetical protein